MLRTARQEREREYWNEHAQNYSDWNEFPYEAWRTYSAIQQQALDFLGSMNGKRLLVCGIGPESILFARAGAEVWGFDISESQVSAARDLVERYGLSDRVHAKSMPFEALDYPNSFFDLAYGNAILHHIDLDQGATELTRVLRSGGKASFIEPLGANALLEFARRHLPYRGKGRTEDERPLSYHDLKVFRRHFATSMYREFALLSMLRGRVITNRSIIRSLEALDKIILERAPWIRRFCAQIWIGIEVL